MRLLFSSQVLRRLPPWLRRPIAKRLLESLAEPLDDLADRMAEGVKARFPNESQADALPLIGRERRIRRGPAESDASYARRLRLWLDSHRGRGGPYALLGQLYAYFLDSFGVRIDVVYYSGTRRWVDTAGTVTRDAITWAADASGDWAQIWIFWHLASLPTLTSALAAEFRAIPREWDAAHLKQVTLVLLAPSYELWGYPQPVGAWNDPPGATWNAGPHILTVL